MPAPIIIGNRSVVSAAENSRRPTIINRCGVLSVAVITVGIFGGIIITVGIFGGIILLGVRGLILGPVALGATLVVRD